MTQVDHVPNQSLRVCIRSANQGCKPNVIQCTQLIDYCQRNGHILVNELGQADVVLLNSCGVTKHFEDRTISMVQEFLKQQRPGARIFVIGCLSIVNRKQLQSVSPLIEAVTDLTELDRVIGQTPTIAHCQQGCLTEELVRKFEQHEEQEHLTKKAALLTGRLLERLYGQIGYPNLGAAQIPDIIDEFTLRNMVYVQIGTGCSNHCHYCIIKKAKGDTRSRTIAQILEDVGLVSKPGKVLSLVMEDCGSFGVDTGESFPQLVKAITRQYPDVAIDISAFHPRWLLENPDPYLEMFASAAIKSINITLQSGSDRVLAAMNRRYSAAAVLNRLAEIQKAAPGLFLWTHFMVGYPGETWNDFLRTLQTSLFFPFYYVFAFSPRGGTVAATIPNNNPRWVRVLRRQIMHTALGLRLSLRLLW